MRRSTVERLVAAVADGAASLLGRARLRSLGVRIPVGPRGWSIGYDDALVITRELRRFEQRRRVNVVEFGSGMSTYVLLSTLQDRFDDYQFSSVEADRQWYEQVTRQVAKSYPAAAGRFMLIHSPYVDRTFDVESVWAGIPFERCDVIVVDAPPDTQGEDVRLELCLRLLPRLAPKGTLILHDTNRINEMFAFTRLRALFEEAERIETRKGISVFRIPRP